MDDGIRRGFRFGLTLSLHSASGIALALIEGCIVTTSYPIMSLSLLVTSSFWMVVAALRA
ncbi:hypothetical protein V8E52_000829 [Russula decolorans]